MRAVKEKANAKINLYLDVISKRDDGFHDIKTVMHSISLCDELTVIYRPSSVTKIRMFVKGNKFLPTDEKNLAFKAAKAFVELARITADIEIRLVKRIPIAAGLAGGSSDAAATLRALNKLFGKLFSDRALFNLAASLGSDVPYCLYGKTALCEGRGEIITKLPDALKLNVVVAVANERVSTPAAYTRLDAVFSDFDGSVKSIGDSAYENFVLSLQDGNFSDNSFYNIFEKAVFELCPGAQQIKKRMYELGAKSALMSGSGPSVFGIFASEDEAKRVCNILRSEKITSYTARSV